MNLPLLKSLSEAPGVPGREERVRKILGTLPEPDPSLAISLEEGNDADFDQQLEGL